MTELIGHISASLTMAKALVEIADNFNKAQYIQQISELTMQLAKVQIEASAMMTELRTLKAELEERDNNPITYDGFVYRDKDNVMYCPKCYDSERKRIHLKNPYVAVTGRTIAKCPNCPNHFEVNE